MRKWTHEVEVANNGPCFGAGRKVELGGGLAGKEEECHSG